MKFSRNIDPTGYEKLTNDRKRLEFLINLANLAPSSHNMQPWKFRIDGSTIILVADHSLRLKVADPDGREFSITLGTVIGGIQMTAQAYGLDFDMNILASVDSDVATFRFKNLLPKNVDYATLDAFINRHNSRLPYKKDPVPQTFLDKIANIAAESGDLKLVIDDQKKEEVEKIILKSVKEAFQDKAFTTELAPWLKSSLGKKEDGLPGYNLGMPFFMSLIFPFLTKHFDISDLQVKIHKRMLDNASVYAIICNDDESPKTWLKIGQAFIRIAVEAQRDGLSIGVMQASVENSADRVTLQKALGTVQKPQMFFRLGFCDLHHNHSPRRPLEKILVK